MEMADAPLCTVCPVLAQKFAFCVIGAFSPLPSLAAFPFSRLLARVVASPLAEGIHLMN